MLAGMFFQIVVGAVAVAATAFFLQASAPPAAVYVAIMVAAVWFAVRLRAWLQYGRGAKVSFTPTRALYPDGAQSVWLGRPTGDQLGAFWRDLHRRFIVRPPALSGWRRRGR